MLQNLQKKSHERSHALMCSSTYQYPRHMQPSARLHTLLSDFSKAFLQKTIQWNQNTLIVLIPSSFFHTHVYMCRLTAAHTQSEKMFQHNTRSWHWWSGLTAWQWAKLVMVHNVRHPPPTHTHTALQQACQLYFPKDLMMRVWIGEWNGRSWPKTPCLRTWIVIITVITKEAIWKRTP